jgi:hypothetical protein
VAEDDMSLQENLQNSFKSLTVKFGAWSKHSIEIEKFDQICTISGGTE